MKVEVFPLGPLETNCFLIHNGREAVAVDPGGSPAPVLDYLEKEGLTLTRILLTHLHFDHTYGVAELALASGATVLASGLDRYMLESELGRGGVWGLPLVEDYDFEDLKPGDITLLDSACSVLATPGHTPGGLSFYFPDIQAVFAGDALFYRSIGRSDFPGGSQQTLVASIRETLFALPDETTVYPGHGDKTRIGDERRNNPFVSDFAAG